MDKKAYPYQTDVYDRKGASFLKEQYNQQDGSAKQHGIGYHTADTCDQVEYTFFIESFRSIPGEEKKRLGANKRLGKIDDGA